MPRDPAIAVLRLCAQIAPMVTAAKKAVGNSEPVSGAAATQLQQVERGQDPHCMLGAQIDILGTRYAYEVCDAAEADEHAYDIDAARISGFVTPEWFTPRLGGPWRLHGM